MIETLDTIYGPLTIFDTDIAQYPWVKNTGASVDDPQIELVRDLLAEVPRGTIVDVGASYGCWSLGLHDLADFVIAIEPQEAVFDLFCQTLMANISEGKRLMLHCAVWDRERTFRLPAIDYAAPDNFGGISLKDTHLVGPLIEARPLDNLIDKDRHVSFIKIDVEGSEREALLGATETIRRCKPILFVEWEHEHTHPEGLRQQIDAMGYEMERHGPNLLCVPL